MVNGFDIKMIVKSYAIEIIFKSWDTFGYISTANLAQLLSKRAGQAVLYSW